MQGSLPCYEEQLEDRAASGEGYLSTHELRTAFACGGDGGRWLFRRQESIFRVDVEGRFMASRVFCTRRQLLARQRLEIHLKRPPLRDGCNLRQRAPSLAPRLRLKPGMFLALFSSKKSVRPSEFVVTPSLFDFFCIAAAIPNNTLRYRVVHLLWLSGCRVPGSWAFDLVGFPCRTGARVHVTSDANVH